MKFIQIVALPLILILVGCGRNEAPNCSDKETTDLVVQIESNKVYEHLRPKIQLMWVDDIRTLNHNKNVGSYYCAANFYTTHINGKTFSFPITYTSELIDSKDKFYVTVYD